MLKDAVRVIARQRCNLKPDQVILVGVSGGPDSICLVHLLKSLDYPLVVAHLDHQLRAESASDAEQVRQWMHAWGLECICGSEDVSRVAATEHWSIEEAARNIRYRFLFRLAMLSHAQAVATGHTADDQVETVLMHFLRGAGLAGLRGMRPRTFLTEWSHTVPLVRPLLFSWREETVGYCQEHGLPFLEDATNQDLAIYRNRLRWEAIPYLERLNPGFKSRSAHMTDILTGDEEILEQMVDWAWQRCVIEKGADYIAVDREPLSKYSVGLRRRIARRAISILLGDQREIDFIASERAADFFCNPPSTGSLDLVAGIHLITEGFKIYLYCEKGLLPIAQWPQLESQEPQFLGISQKIDLANDWRLTTSKILRVDLVGMDKIQNAPREVAWLDFDRLSLPLLVRAWEPGDRFNPLGMEGHSTKVSDLFVNHKIPSRARSRWPVVLSGEIPCWLPGLSTSENFRVTGDTRHLIQLKLVKPKNR